MEELINKFISLDEKRKEYFILAVAPEICKIFQKNPEIIPKFCKLMQKEE